MPEPPLTTPAAVTTVPQQRSSTRGRPQKTPTQRTPAARTDAFDTLFQQDQSQLDLFQQDPFRQDLAQQYQPQQDQFQQVTGLFQQDPFQQDLFRQPYNSDSYSSQPDSYDFERHLWQFYSEALHWEEEVGDYYSFGEQTGWLFHPDDY